MKANPQHCPELSGALQGFVLTTCRSEPPRVLEGEGCTCVCVCVCAINCLQAGEGESSCAFPMKDFILKKENWFCSIQKW